MEHCVDGKPPADKLAELCTDDIVFMVGPQARPQVGLEKVKAGWENFPPGWKSAGWTVVSHIAAGDTVMNERIDRFDVGGTIVAMPCAVRYPPPAASAVSALCPLTGSGCRGSGRSGTERSASGETTRRGACFRRSWREREKITGPNRTFNQFVPTVQFRFR